MDNDLTPVHILLVEDNPQDVEITRRALEKGQVKNRLTVARDGQEALDILEAIKSDDPPALILLDLNMPRLNGIEVLQVIKSDPNLRRIPVIVLTTSTREEDIVRAYDLGVNTFISKPVRFEDFMRVVMTIQEYWILIATLPSAARV
jgi:two-component system, chemotaxis family, response regulator Rcp1